VQKDGVVELRKFGRQKREFPDCSPMELLLNCIGKGGKGVNSMNAKKMEGGSNGL
jgi:hypothetical protein